MHGLENRFANAKNEETIIAIGCNDCLLEMTLWGCNAILTPVLSAKKPTFAAINLTGILKHSIKLKF